MNKMSFIMKRNRLILCLITVLSVEPVPGQAQPPSPPAPAPQPASPSFAQRLTEITQKVANKPSPPALTRFNLNFHGGTPKELRVAIEAALGRPLNAIVPPELADTKLPALQMNNVDVAQLFTALSSASRKQEYTRSGGGISSWNVSFGFRTSDNSPTDDSIWYFYAEKPTAPPPPQQICRFYPLASYLEDGIKVDDITTAIQTGWKMLGETSAPAISFHKDTKLLIAVGDPTKMETIDAVLKALETQQRALQTASIMQKAREKITTPADSTNAPKSEK